MNIYTALNQITAYIDENLDHEIDHAKITSFIGANPDTTKRIFSVITGISLSDYIRKRRLSSAAQDLFSGMKVIDTALKYGYDNPVSFSRAFENFHGTKPSLITKTTKLKNYPRITFTETKAPSDIEYEIFESQPLTLYGLKTPTDNEHISHDAPKHFTAVEKANLSTYGPPDFGMITYDNRQHNNCTAYYVLYKKPIPAYERIEIPAAKWLKFITNSTEAAEIQATSQRFYDEFLPSSNYHLHDLPELEYYHDGITEFWAPID